MRITYSYVWYFSVLQLRKLEFLKSEGDRRIKRGQNILFWET